MTTDIYGLRVLLLRAENVADNSFENRLRSAGHRVTVISSREAAFSLISSMRPDAVVFDPISEFGFSGTVQGLCTSFDGPVVAIGLSSDSAMAASLQHLGVARIAKNAAELLEIVRDIPVAPNNNVGADQANLPVTEKQQLVSQPVSQPVTNRVRTTGKQARVTRPDPAPTTIKHPLDRWHWAMAGVAAVAVVVAVVALLLPRPAVDAPVAKALPVVPGILLRPLVPLTIEELSGDTLPLEISGIKDRTVIDEPAVAFWGDTAPDAFVTVNGDHVEVSEYGAFVIDYPLDDGANFIEVLASDFQGRTTRVSFTVVRTQ